MCPFPFARARPPPRSSLDSGGTGRGIAIALKGDHRLGPTNVRYRRRRTDTPLYRGSTCTRPKAHEHKGPCRRAPARAFSLAAWQGPIHSGGYG